MPSSTLVAAAEAALPLRRRQRRPFVSVTLCLPVFSSLQLPPPPPPRDWAAGLPPELLSCILHRLDPVQIMLGPDKVCRSWRRAARDEPELWRRIDMRGNKALSERNLIDLDQMAVEAVRRSQGQCQEFLGETDVLHDEFIHYLGDQAPLLKRLILIRAPLLKRLILVSGDKLSGQGFMHAVKGFPLLEELHLSMRWDDAQRARVFEVIAKKCPHLKHLTVCNARSYGDGYIGDKEAMAIAGMRELRSLQLPRQDLTDRGLAAILDNCIYLKSLGLINCYNLHMTPEVEAKIKTKKLLMNSSSNGRRCFDDYYSSDGSRWDSFDEPDSPTSECSTCFNYFRRSYRPDNEAAPIDEKEANVISAVRELRSLELYRNDLTIRGLTAVLDKCAQLEPLDVWNCLNIVKNNNNALRAKCHQMKAKELTTALRATTKWHRIKAKKLTTKLLMDRSNPDVFNPEYLDIRNCRIMVMNSLYGRILMNNKWLGAKCKRLKLGRWAKKYHESTKKMKARIEQYLAKLPWANLDYMDFEGVKVEIYPYWRNYGEFGDVEFEPGSPTSECSTCLMLEYLAGRWGVLDLDDYSDYYDSSYGLDVLDEIEFQVHDRMAGKRFRRYLKMG